MPNTRIMKNENEEDNYKQIQTRDNYDKLLNSGMFWEFYPELSGNWEIDRKGISPGRDKITILDTPDMRPLIQTCEEYMNFRQSKKYYDDNDFETYIFEAALKSLYGEDVFNKLNKLPD